MKLSKLIIVLAILGALVLSCEEAALKTEPIGRIETTSTEEAVTCTGEDFEFIKVSFLDNALLLDALAPSDSVETVTSYSWKVTQTVDNETAVSLFDSGDNTFGWRIFDGELEVCLTTTTASCPEGATICKTLATSPEQFNNATSGNAENITVVPTEDGNYALDVELKTTDCRTYDFDLEVERAFFIGGITSILRAPNVSDINKDNIVFKWTINENINGETTTTDDLGGGENVAAFVLTYAGTYEICLTITHLDCVEGAITCKTLVISDLQFDNANTDVENIERIDVVPAADGNFTIEVIRQ